MQPASQELFACLESFLERLFALAEADAVDLLLDLDVSFSQARTMFVLAHIAEPIPITEIARRLGLSQAAAGRNVDQLVQLGIVQRHECSDDRRVRLVALSPKGFEVADQHVQRKRQAILAVTQRLPVEDCERLTAALRPILAGNYLSVSTKTKEQAHGDR